MAYTANLNTSNNTERQTDRQRELHFCRLQACFVTATGMFWSLHAVWTTHWQPLTIATPQQSIVIYASLTKCKHWHDWSAGHVCAAEYSNEYRERQRGRENVEQQSKHILPPHGMQLSTKFCKQYIYQVIPRVFRWGMLQQQQQQRHYLALNVQCTQKTLLTISRVNVKDPRIRMRLLKRSSRSVSYTHLRAHETG